MWQTALRTLSVWLRVIPKPDYVARLALDRPTPEAIRPGCLYVLGGRGYQKWAYFLCPTGSGEIIQLSLAKDRRPRWTVAIDLFGRPTIDPSVRQLEGSYAHFFVRQGKVDWCPDSGRPPRRFTPRHDRI